VTFTTRDSQSQPYVLQAGDAVSAVFDDASLALFNAWSANAHPFCTLSQAGGKTTVTLLAGFGQATVQGAPLPANLGIETFFGNGLGTIAPINGSTCQGHAEGGPPR